MEGYIVKKLSRGNVGFTVPGETRGRHWKGQNARIRLSYEELEKCIYDNDVRALFERGYLRIEDKDIRIKLGLEDPDSTVSNDNKTILDEEELLPVLYEYDFSKFKETIENLAEATYGLLPQVAIDTSKQLSFEKSDYIRKNFHIDVERIQRERREEMASTTKEG